MKVSSDETAPRNTDPSKSSTNSLDTHHPDKNLSLVPEAKPEIARINLVRLKEVPQYHPAWNDLFDDLACVHLPRAFRNDLNEKERNHVATDTIVVLWKKKIQDAHGPGYIYTIANNLALRHLKERSKEWSRFESLSAAEDPDNGYSEGLHKMDVLSQAKYDHESDRREMMNLMQEALDTLNEKDREFIVGYAKFVEANPESRHLSQDFGAIHKLTAVNVRRKLGIIRSQLRGYLQKQQADGN